MALSPLRLIPTYGRPILLWGRGGASVESMPFERRVAGSNPALETAQQARDKRKKLLTRSVSLGRID